MVDEGEIEGRLSVAIEIGRRAIVTFLGSGNGEICTHTRKTVHLDHVSRHFSMDDLMDDRTDSRFVARML